MAVLSACGDVDPTDASGSGSLPSTEVLGTAVTRPTVASPFAPVPDHTEWPTWQKDLAALRIAEPGPRDRYDRAEFGQWVDADQNSCNTRCEVLLREYRTDLSTAPTGGWRSAYDGRTMTASADVDVDHTVALSEAWVSGASAWGEQRLNDFTNDLGPGALHAVSASVNRSKSDRDPAEWQPPDQASWCTYAADWIRTKNRWDLAADVEEFTTLSTMLQSCP